jgi:hypothetical protein
LGLPLEDAGFDPSIMSEFRTRLVEQEQASLLFDLLLRRLFEDGLVRPGGRVRTDSTHVLGAVQQLNRLALVRESVRAALNALALAAPDWLVEHADPRWVERSAARSENQRVPTQEATRAALAQQIGQDGSALVAAIDAPAAPVWLRELPALQVLRTVWIQQDYPDESGQRLRTPEELPPCAQAIASPGLCDRGSAQLPAHRPVAGRSHPGQHPAGSPGPGAGPSRLRSTPFASGIASSPPPCASSMPPSSSILRRMLMHGDWLEGTGAATERPRYMAALPGQLP